MKRFAAAVLVGAGALIATLAMVQVPATATPKATDSGEQVFVEHKCNQCHTVKSAGIKRTKAKKKNSDPPDLSGVGNKHERQWIGRFLQKKETIEGRKHKKKFRGDDAEQKALLDWLTSLKS